MRRTSRHGRWSARAFCRRSRKPAGRVRRRKRCGRISPSLNTESPNHQECPSSCAWTTRRRTSPGYSRTNGLPPGLPRARPGSCSGPWDGQRQHHAQPRSAQHPVGRRGAQGGATHLGVFRCAGRRLTVALQVQEATPAKLRRPIRRAGARHRFPGPVPCRMAGIDASFPPLQRTPNGMACPVGIPSAHRRDPREPSSDG